MRLAKRWANDVPLGLLDSNVVVHSLTNDEHSEECRRFLDKVCDGSVTVILDPLVVHEMTYTIPHYVKQMTRQDIADFLQVLMLQAGISGDLPRLRSAVERWKNNPGIGFVDCYLAEVASDLGTPVFTKNVRHFIRLGLDAPEPLPGS